LGVLEGRGEGGLRDPDRARRDVDAPDLEARHDVLEALALLADEVRGRDRKVLERDLGRLDALVAELREVAADRAAGDRLPGVVELLGEEERDAPVRRVGLRVGLDDEPEHRPGARVRRPHLAAVHDVGVAAPDGDAADALRVAAGVRLGEAERGTLLAARHRRQEALPLLVVPERPDDVRDHQVRVQDAGQAHPAAAELLHDHRVRRHVQAEAAELLGDGRAEEAELLHAIAERLRVLVPVLELARDRQHLLLDEGADAGHQVVIDASGIRHAGNLLRCEAGDRRHRAPRGAPANSPPRARRRKAGLHPRGVRQYRRRMVRKGRGGKRKAAGIRRRMLFTERALWETGIELIAGVAAAVVLPRDVQIDGVRDSKLVNARQREALDRAIRDIALGVGIGIVETDEVDRVNVYQAGLLAMARAVASLPILPHHLLVDARQIPDCAIRQTCVAGGDRTVYSIATASIVAKVHRDRLMAEMDTRFPGYGFARHAGYAT